MIQKFKDFWKRESEQFKIHTLTTLLVFGVVGGILMFALFPNLLAFFMPTLFVIALLACRHLLIKSIRE